MVRRLIFRTLKIIDRWHWVWLMVAAPFLLFPSAKRSLAMLVIPILWILRLIVFQWEKKIENLKLKIEKDDDVEGGRLKVENKESIEDDKLKIEDWGFPVTPLNLSLLVLVLMVLVSTWATYSIEQSLEKISGVVLGLGVFYAVVRFGKNFARWSISMAGFLAGGLAWAGLGFLALDYQVRFSFLAPIIERIPNIISGLPGAESGLQHNAVGGTIIWFLPIFIVLSIYLFFSKTDRVKKEVVEGLRLKVEDEKKGVEGGRWKVEGSTDNKTWGSLIKRLLRFTRNDSVIWIFSIMMWLGTLFIGGVLVLTQSRGSYLAFFITLMAIAFLVLKGRWRWIYTGIVVILIVAGVGVVYQTGGWEQFVTAAGLSDQSGLSINTLEGRLEIWSRAIYGIQDFPITGMGMNTFREVVHGLYPLFIISPDVDIAHAHNEFLQVALDLGIPGLITFISIYVISMWMMVKIWRVDKYQHMLSLNKTIILGLGGGLFGHMVFGMADAITLGAKPGIFYWYLLGLIASYYKLKVELVN